MEIGQTLRVTTRKAWRTWLEKNHARKKEIWLVYATKKSGKARVAYSDAVEEALCFGWIDGTMKSIDENYFAQRFTPRRSAAKISPVTAQPSRPCRFPQPHAH